MRNSFINATHDRHGLLILSQGENDRLRSTHVRQITKDQADKLLAVAANKEARLVYQLDLGIKPSEGRVIWVAREDLVIEGPALSREEREAFSLYLQQDDYSSPPKTSVGHMKR